MDSEPKEVVVISLSELDSEPKEVVVISLSESVLESKVSRNRSRCLESELCFFQF